MIDKKSLWSTNEKVRIVLPTFNPLTSTAEICRKHNLVFSSPRKCATDL